MSLWDIASVFFKLTSLLSMAMVLGGGFGYLLIANLGIGIKRATFMYIALGAWLGLVSVILFFLLQIGAINQAGFAGMFDRQLVVIIGQSELGLSCGMRLLGYVLALVIILYLRSLQAAERPHPQHRNSSFLSVAGYLIVAVLFSGSFPLTGHVAELGLILRVALTLHVLAAFLWVGALYPLFLSLRESEEPSLRSIMEKFGQIAVYVVGLLVLTGGLMAFELLETPGSLLMVPYGVSLLVKLIGVAALLGLAASNKFWIVPNLERQLGKAHLQSSITLEMVVAVGVIGMTSYLTTVIGTSH